MSLSTMLLAALQATAPPLQPVTPWELNGEDMRCTLLRRYGDGADAVTIGVRLDLIDEQPRFVMFADQRPEGALAQAELEVTTDDVSAGSATYIAGSIPKKGWALESDTIHGLTPDRLASATNLSFEAGRYRQTIALRGAKAAVAALRKCNDDLARSFGVDLSFRDRISTPPEAIAPQNWIRVADYPSGAIKSSQQGSAVIRWTVDATGRVDNFAVAKSSGYPLLDQAALNALRSRARYRPAQDRQGAAMAVPMVRIVTWQLPQSR